MYAKARAATRAAFLADSTPLLQSLETWPYYGVIGDPYVPPPPPNTPELNETGPQLVRPGADGPPPPTAGSANHAIATSTSFNPSIKCNGISNGNQPMPINWGGPPPRDGRTFWMYYRSMSQMFAEINRLRRIGENDRAAEMQQWVEEKKLWQQGRK